MQEYTLVVVDMQPDFPAANQPATIAAVEREIRDAMRHHQPIVFLELAYFSPMDPEGLRPTHRCLMQLLSGYDRFDVRQKNQNAGSRHIMSTCAEKGFCTSRFRLCGVNTDACVIDTTVALSDDVPDAIIEVVQDACNTCSAEVDWHIFSIRKNIRLLPPATTTH